jgi:hypothetical protein
MYSIKSVLVLPVHDPQGILFSYLRQIRPQLTGLFEHAFISVSPQTGQEQTTAIHTLQQDPFFSVTFNRSGSTVGEHYMVGYQSALADCQPQTLLHLCDLDKLCYVLLRDHCQTYTEDVAWANRQKLPVLFQRSNAAWDTFPANYREIETFAIRLGEMIFNRYIDFAWSYMVIDAATLAALLPTIASDGFSLLLKILLQLKGNFLTKDVDWLSWEDPFILGRNAEELRHERETSLDECAKRLSYTLPNLQLLYEYLENNRVRNKHS